MPSYKSNAKKVIGNLTKKFNRLSKTETDKIARTASTTLLAEIGNRVFQDGEASNEGLIGNYSHRDMLVGRTSFFKRRDEVGKPITSNTIANKLFGDKKKRSKLQWVTTKKGKKLAVLPGGYAALRQIMGRQAGKVDLHFTGRLLSEWNIAGRKNKYVLGFIGSYGKRVSNALEDKYKKQIWNSTSTERKQIVTIFENGINVVLK